MRVVVAGLRVDLQGREVSGARLSSHLIAAAVRGFPDTRPWSSVESLPATDAPDRFFHGIQCGLSWSRLTPSALRSLDQLRRSLPPCRPRSTNSLIFGLGRFVAGCSAIQILGRPQVLDGGVRSVATRPKWHKTAAIDLTGARAIDLVGALATQSGVRPRRQT